MTTTAELTTLTIADAAELLSTKRISSTELTEAYLDRIEKLNPSINAYVMVTADRAREDARRATDEIAAGNYRGPLHGIPIGLKDLYDTAGIRTSGGCKAYEDRVPADDCTVARKLRRAGSVLLGKLNTHELAYGTTTNNHWYGATHNPWDLERIPGGSSGGSGAATIADMAAGTMGTDTGGSIRIPASLCGCVGLKPTYGRVSKAGVMMMSWQLDHPGPLTKTVRDAAIMLTAVQGYDPQDAATVRVGRVDYASAFEAGMQGLVIGVPRAYYWESLDPEVAEACEAALKVFSEIGAVVREVDVPSFAPYLRPTFDMVRTEAIEFHAERLAANPDGFSPELHAILGAGPLSGLDYVKAQRGVYEFTQGVRAAFEPVSLLVMPTTPGPASPIGGAASGFENTAPFNATGMPALSLPCGFTVGGLPIGLQIVGREFDEWTVIRAAHGYEQATDWHKRRPTLG